MQTDPVKFNYLLSQWDNVPQYKVRATDYALQQLSEEARAKVRDILMQQKLKKVFGQYKIMLAIYFLDVHKMCIGKQMETSMPDRSANSHQGVHEDQHGKFVVQWVNAAEHSGWYYVDSGMGCATGRNGDEPIKDNEPFDTSEEAYEAATSYGE